MRAVPPFTPRRIFPLLLFFLSVLFLPPASAGDRPCGITVFLLDTPVDPEFVRGNINLGEPVTHGSLVGRTLTHYCRGCEVISIPVDDGTGRIVRKHYLEALASVSRYMEKHPTRKVIVNMSLGSYAYDAREHLLVQALARKGACIVAAAGNDAAARPLYPAAYPETVAVAQCESGRKAPRSNYGPHIDIACSGRITFVDIDAEPYRSLRREISARGTSFAAPKVSALIASLCMHDPDLTPAEAAAVVKRTAVPLPEDPYFKAGLLGAGEMSGFRALSAVDPLHPLKAFYVPLAAAVSVIVSTILLVVKYRAAGLLISLGLWVVIVPTLLIYGAASVEIVRAAGEWGRDHGWGALEWILLLGGAAGGTLFSAFSPFHPPGRYVRLLALFLLLSVSAGYLPWVDLPPLLHAVLIGVFPLLFMAGGAARRAVRRKRLAARGEEVLPVLAAAYAGTGNAREALFAADTIRLIPGERSRALLWDILAEEYAAAQGHGSSRREHRRVSTLIARTAAARTAAESPCFAALFAAATPCPPGGTGATLPAPPPADPARAFLRLAERAFPLPPFPAAAGSSGIFS